MNFKLCAALLVSFACSLAAAQADDAAADNAQLRAEIARLKAENQALRQACPAARAPAAAAASATATAMPAAVQPAAADAAGRSMADVEMAPPPPPSAPPRAYADTGCNRSLFRGPPPGKWQDGKRWEGLHQGMSMAEVEAVLGVEHYDEAADGKVKWEYGRCGRSYEGIVVFAGGSVTAWSPPD